MVYAQDCFSTTQVFWHLDHIPGLLMKDYRPVFYSKTSVFFHWWHRSLSLSFFFNFVITGLKWVSDPTQECYYRSLAFVVFNLEIDAVSRGLPHFPTTDTTNLAAGVPVPYFTSVAELALPSGLPKAAPGSHLCTTSAVILTTSKSCIHTHTNIKFCPSYVVLPHRRPTYSITSYIPTFLPV